MALSCFLGNGTRAAHILSKRCCCHPEPEGRRILKIKRGVVYMKTYRFKNLILIGIVGIFSMVQLACEVPWEKKPIDEPNPYSNFGALAPDDPDLKILVQTKEKVSWIGNREVKRLKVITEQEFDSKTGYIFIGRVYDEPRNGFSMPVYEYFLSEGSFAQTQMQGQHYYIQLVWGFRVDVQECVSPYTYNPYVDIVCPVEGNNISKEPLFYSYGIENPGAGIYQLNQYGSQGQPIYSLNGNDVTNFYSTLSQFYGPILDINLNTLELYTGNLEINQHPLSNPSHIYIYAPTQRDIDQGRY